MPAAIAIPLITAGATAGAGIYAANKQSSTAKTSGDQQIAAANHAADLQSQSTAEALAFQRQQAENEWLNSQQTQRANYDQSRNRYGSIAGVASQYGLNLGAMPDYSPGIDPHYTGDAGTVAGSAAPATGMPAVDPSKGDLAGQISAYFKSRGVSDQETPYWVAKWSEFGAKDPAYFNQRLAAADVFGKSGAAPAGSIAGARVNPYQTAAGPTGLAPTTAIPTPYQPGTIGAAMRRL